MTPVARILALCPDVEVARMQATALLDARLVACANIGAAVESRHEWQSLRLVEPEVPVRPSAQPELVAAVTSEIGRRHPYGVPTVVADRVEANDACADRVRGMTTPAGTA